jgi:Dolichyl-phosphate-mannose-protein mannosyltransferase
MNKQKKRVIPSNQNPDFGQEPMPNVVILSKPTFQLTTWFWLLGLFFLAVFLRWRLIDIPLERDESAYSYLGQRLLEGGRPYIDFYEMKPPLIFVSYAIINLIFGYSASGLHWAALFFTLVNAGLIYAIAKRFYAEKYALLACFCYIILTSNPNSTAVMMSSELIVMAFALGAVVLSIVWKQRQLKSKWMLFGSGFLLALATLTKQTGILFGAIPAFLILHNYWINAPKNSRNLVSNTLFIALGFLLPVVVCAFWLICIGSWKDFVFWNFTYLKMYGSIIKFEDAKIHLNGSFYQASKDILLYWLLGLLGIFALFMRNLPLWQRVSIGLMVASGGVPVFLGYRFFLHYWLYFLPIIAILVGHFGYSLLSFLENKNKVWMGWAFMLMALLYPIKNLNNYWFNKDLGSIVNEMFYGNAFAEDKVLADFLKKRIQPDDSFVALGSEPQFYVYLNQKAPSRHFFSSMLSRNTEHNKIFQQEALSDLLKSKPKYIVFPFIVFSWMLVEDANRTYYNGAWYMMKKDYKIIACAEYKKGQKTTYFMDAAAENHKPSTEEFIYIAERK